MDINGVEILKQTEVITTKYNPVLFWIGIVFLALAIVFLICEIWYFSNYTFLNDPFDIIVVVCLAISILAFVFGSIYKRTEPTGQYMYEAFIDDSVGIKEIYERYEIVDAKGDIYILKDKEDRFYPSCDNKCREE